MTYRYGGLDVNFNSLMRQTVKPDVWIIADDMCDSRRELVRDKTRGCPFDVIHFRPREKPEGYFSDLANIYNEMLECADSESCDFAVSCQDFLWVPDDGFEKFTNAWVELGERALVSGTCSQSIRPGPDEIANNRGLWTIYSSEYSGAEQPDEDHWHDVRIDQFPPGDMHYRTVPINWELNWAMIPLYPFAQGVRFPEHYGEGIGHENIAFAVECCIQQDCSVWINPGNYTVSLPHKAYWPEQEASGGPKSVTNMEMFAREYGQLGITVF